MVPQANVTTLLMSNSGHIIEMLVFWKLGNTLACHVVLKFFSSYLCVICTIFSRSMFHEIQNHTET